MMPDESVLSRTVGEDVVAYDAVRCCATEVIESRTTPPTETSKSRHHISGKTKTLPFLIQDAVARLFYQFKANRAPGPEVAPLIATPLPAS
jgi:hypothetical protein